ncbi:PAS domain S-box protein [Larkinella sp. C7]|uniref:PAS domain-containing sensor histidine kinase n=1 Tax=Larkinella sp. C7 TaxID=2576607 RepID=UPI00148616B7|nr:PAS domain S-box protein [Larkinella sp. C7]
MNKPASSPDFPAGGGEMGNRIRSFDWSATSLGPLEHWSHSLKTTLNLILSSRFPMFLFWGAEHLFFYNDAFRPSFGAEGKHPGALGRKGETVWPESWPIISPLIDQVRAKGEATWSENLLIPLFRNNRLDAIYWTLSCSPAYDDNGQISGVLVVCIEKAASVAGREKGEENESYFRQLIETMPAILWITEADGYCSYLNKQWYDHTGQSDKDAEGFGWLNMTHPDDQQEAGTKFIEANEKQVPFTALYRLRSKAGHYRWAIDSGTPRFNAAGQYEGMIGTVVDVHDQKLAEESLRESDARFRTLIAEAPVAMAVYAGLNFVIEMANDAMIHVWGKTPAVIGMELAEALPELEGQPFIGLLEEVFKTGVPYQSAEQQADLVVDGRLQSFWFTFTYQPLTNEQGQVYAILNVALDVTAQRRARQKIEEAESALRDAVELAELSTWSMEVETGLFTYSDRFMHWLGFSENTKSMDEAFNPLPDEYRQSVADAIAAVTQPGSSGFYDNEHPIINRLTGQVRIIHAQARLFIDAEGKPLRLVGTAQDITEQRKVQIALEHQVQERTEELEATNEELASTNEELAATIEELATTNEELSESNQLLMRSNENLEQFAYIASHDLQEPLRKVQQFGDLLKNQYFSQLGDGINYLERMQLAAGRMSALIKDLLTFSRISTQQDTVEPVSLAVVVKTVVNDLELVIQESKAVVTVDPLPTVPGDSSQLEQLFQNLLSNALKFRRKGADGMLVTPEIRVTAQIVSSIALPTTVKPARAAGAYHCIEVKDNGIGFDQKYVDRIFQVFQRLHGKAEFAGTGIGLAICEKVASNHGGAITATSQSGLGATFSVYLPVAESLRKERGNPL